MRRARSGSGGPAGGGQPGKDTRSRRSCPRRPWPARGATAHHVGAEARTRARPAQRYEVDAGARLRGRSTQGYEPGPLPLVAHDGKGPWSLGRGAYPSAFFGWDLGRNDHTDEVGPETPRGAISCCRLTLHQGLSRLVANAPIARSPDACAVAGAAPTAADSRPSHRRQVLGSHR